MEVEMLKLDKDSEGMVRYEVNGVMLRENRLPRVGLSTVRHIGSDSYAQKIVEVAPDFSWYKLSTNEIAVLVTRKNSRRYGKYVLGELIKGKGVPFKTPYITCMNHDTFWMVDYEAKTELDPSF